MTPEQKARHPLFARPKTAEEALEIMLEADRRMDQTGETRRVRDLQLLLCGMKPC